jgi:hemerythrin
MTTTGKDQLGLGHEALDKEHLVLLDLLAAALQAAETGTRPEAEARVAALADALHEHMALEDELMERSAFPDRARHQAAHELFLADFAQLRDELREKGPTPLVEEWLRVRIPEWLRFHVLVNDVRLVEHLKAPRPAAGAPRRPAGRSR